MENKEFKDEEIEILGWDEFGIKQLAKVTIDGLSTEVYLVPDFDDMSLEELEEYYEKLEDRYDDLQAEEPEDEESDEYSEWEDRFEFIEELLEQVEEAKGERKD